MADHFEELRTARKEGTPPLHRLNLSQLPERFQELRTARREDRSPTKPNIAKKRDDTAQTPNRIEPHGHDEINERYPKGDSPLVDALRKRSRSSPPLHTQAPPLRLRTFWPRKIKKRVRWAEPLEEPTPEKMGSPKYHIERRGLKCILRRRKPSSIPRPIFRSSSSKSQVAKKSCLTRRPTPVATIKVTLTTEDRESPQRLSSPLVPQASPLRSIPSCVSAFEVQVSNPQKLELCDPD